MAHGMIYSKRSRDASLRVAAGRRLAHGLPLNASWIVGRAMIRAILWVVGCLAIALVALVGFGMLIGAIEGAQMSEAATRYLYGHWINGLNLALAPFFLFFMYTLSFFFSIRGWCARYMTDAECCGNCGYVLQGIKTERCPECGKPTHNEA